jgi:predicted NAD/FAD-dependent oxidoreductase
MRVAVIGAGIAGLSAARRLADRRHDVVVLERGSAPGGRVGTRRVLNAEADRPELSSLSFDHGAQYFTVRDARFDREVQAWHRARAIGVWHGKLASFDSEGREAVEDEVTRWVGVPDMGAIARHLARGLDVRCGVDVAGVAADGPGRWRTTTAAGAVDEFDAALLAAPAPEARRLLTDVRLKPDDAGAIASVRMLPCWAALAAFDARVPTPFDGAFVSSSPLGWIARDRSKPQRGFAETWVLHAATAWSAAHVDDRADAVGPFLLNAFADLVRGPMPWQVSLTAQRWRQAAADPPLARGPLGDRGMRLAICGDWCRGTRVEDAWISGLEAAQLIVD